MRKLTYEYVKNSIEFFNFKLLSKEYKNSITKLKVQCNKGHIYEVTWGNFQSGKRCGTCCGKYITHKDIKIKIESVIGYKLLSDNYINDRTKLKIKCNKDHIFYMNWDNFNQGSRCPICSQKLIAKKLKHSYEYVKKQIEKEGYKLLSKKYINNNTYLKVECLKGHKYKTKFASFISGHRCPICACEDRCKNYTPNELKELKGYRANIVQLSNQNYCKYYYQINPKKLERSFRKYQLDHKFSVMAGFRLGIDPEIMANPYNLQMLWWKKNIIKSDKNWQSEKKLYQGYAKYTTEKEK